MSSLIRGQLVSIIRFDNNIACIVDNKRCRIDMGVVMVELQRAIEGDAIPRNPLNRKNFVGRIRVSTPLISPGQDDNVADFPVNGGLFQNQCAIARCRL